MLEWGCLFLNTNASENVTEGLQANTFKNQHYFMQGVYTHFF